MNMLYFQIFIKLNKKNSNKRKVQLKQNLIFSTFNILERMFYEEKEINSLIMDKKKFNISKNLKNGLTIILTKSTDITQLKEHVCILPLTEKSNILSLVNLQPIKTFTTNNFIYSIPDKYIDNMIDDKVWDDSLLNVSCPF